MQPSKSVHCITGTSPNSSIRSEDSFSSGDFLGFECSATAFTSIDLDFSLEYYFRVEVRILILIILVIRNK